MVQLYLADRVLRVSPWDFHMAQRLRSRADNQESREIAFASVPLDEFLVVWPPNLVYSETVVVRQKWARHRKGPDRARGEVG